MHLQTDFIRPGSHSSYQEQQIQPGSWKSFSNEAAKAVIVLALHTALNTKRFIIRW